MWRTVLDPRPLLLPSPLEVAHDMPTEHGWMTTEEVAQTLGMSQDSIRHAIARGTLKAIKVSRINMITPDALDEYRREHLHKQGWDKRKEPGYQPDPKRKARRERLKAKPQEQE